MTDIFSEMDDDPPSLRDVARISGVSVSTASRALTTGESVSDDVLIRVRAVAQSIGYVANLSAQAMRGRRNAIGVIVDDITTSSVADMVTAIQAEGRQHGTLVLATGTSAMASKTAHALRTFRGLNPKAIILISSGADATADIHELEAQLNEYAATGGRVVVLEPTPWKQFASVGLDQAALATSAATYMASLGRHSAVILAGPAGHLAFGPRAQTFASILRSRGMTEEHISTIHSPNNRRSGEEAVAELLLSGTRPQLILGVTDSLALGALRALRAQGVKVPEQVAVSGIDDSPMSKDSQPPLTTVAQPFDLIGRELFRLATIDDVAPSSHIELTGRLVVRGSTPVSTRIS